MHFDWQDNSYLWVHVYKTKSNLDFDQTTWTRLLGSSFSLDKASASSSNDCFDNKKKNM